MQQLILHLIGDYLTQNDWMATNKKNKGFKGFLACFIHCTIYALPFLLITNWKAWLVIYITHFIIDRSTIVNWFLSIRNGTFHIKNFGFGEERPVLITLWLYIITDNVFHIIINYLAIKYIN